MMLLDEAVFEASRIPDDFSDNEEPVLDNKLEEITSPTFLPGDIKKEEKQDMIDHQPEQEPKSTSPHAKLNKKVVEKYMVKIRELINEFAQKLRVKCEDIIRPVGSGDYMKDGVRGGQKLTREQREWLLDPRTISCFRENEWTLEERCEAFRNRFPCSPRLACGTMR